MALFIRERKGNNVCLVLLFLFPSFQTQLTDNGEERIQSHPQEERRMEGDKEHG